MEKVGNPGNRKERHAVIAQGHNAWLDGREEGGDKKPRQNLAWYEKTYKLGSYLLQCELGR